MNKQKRVKQQWCCESCGKNGAAIIYVGTDVWSGFSEVSESHRSASPDCGGSIRLRNRSLCPAGEWGRVVKLARIAALKSKFIVDVPTAKE